MKGILTGALLAGAATAAAAQGITGALQLSHDSDSFNERKESVGYVSAQGWGLRAGALQYSAPGWSESGASLAGTYKKENARQRTEASLGAVRIGGHHYMVGMLDHMQPLRPGTSLGVSAERDFVNSVRGIQEGVAFTSLALVADHAFTDRFNVGVSAGGAAFSNDNNRSILRTRWNYSLAERYGLNAYVKTRNYRNSNPYRPEYFSPERLNEMLLGLSARFVVADSVALSASVDAGRQHIDGGSEPVWNINLGLASRRGSAVEWMVGFEATNSASLFTTSALSYRYVSAVARVRVPF